MSMTTPTTTGTVPGLDMSAILGDPKSNPEPQTALEVALSKVTPADAAAGPGDQTHFQFRDQLSAQQLADLKQNAPAAAERLIGDFNAIIEFGAPVLKKLNDGSIELLNQQRDVDVPGADRIVNDLLRQIDGYEAKFGAGHSEEAFKKIRIFFQGVAYNLKAMKREAKPLVDKINLAEVQLKEMELKLRDNVKAGQDLHKLSTEVLVEVTGVLAAFEEIIEVARADFKVVDDLLQSAQAKAGQEQLATVEYKGKNITLQQLQERHTNLSSSLSEMEKSWFDWRQQYFLGYTNAPTTLNIILVSATMQRRCQVFRTMGIPQARRAIVSWQQTEVAKQGARVGTALQEGTNKLLQSAAEAAGQAVPEIAMASQQPVVSDETIWVILNSIKAQCAGLVAADQWGREQRAKNLKSMEAVEASAQQTFHESRRQLVENAVSAVRTPQALAPAPDVDVLKQLGVTTA